MKQKVYHLGIRPFFNGINFKAIKIFAADFYTVIKVSHTLVIGPSFFNIYPLRWQIELFFKLNKSLLALDKVKGKTQNRIFCEIYAKLIAVILFLYMVAPVKKLSFQQISLYKAINKFKNISSDFLRALTSKYRLSNFLKYLIEDWLSFSQKKRQTKNTGPLWNI